LHSFIEAQTSIFLTTASAEGQPYIQHRGAPSTARPSALPISSAIGNTSRRALSWTTPRRIFSSRLYAAAAHQDLGRGANRRGQNRADGEAYTRTLQGTPRTADPIHRFCLRCQLSDSVHVVTSGGIFGPQGRSADSTVREADAVARHCGSTFVRDRPEIFCK
jgi:hypothetical protein